MAPRLFWRRTLTAAGVYASVALGIAASVVAARVLSEGEFGDFVVVVGAAGFFQTLLDLTAEEALTKYGFQYLESGQPGKLRRLFLRATQAKVAGGVVALVVLAALAPLADGLFDSAGDITAALLIAACLPLVQAPENVAMSAFLLHGRYDLRGLYQSVSMALRLAGVGVGVAFGVTEAVAGLVIGQALSTGVLCIAGRRAFRRLPQAPAESLGADRRGIVGFVLRSSASTGVVALRSTLAPLLLGAVSTTTQAGYLRVAQAPVTGFTAVSSPVRLILLTEHTRDWERRKYTEVLRGVRRYMVVSALVSAPTLPVFYWLMPDLVRIVFGAKYLEATPAARIALFAAFVTLVFGWSKAFPVSIGRPGLRFVAHSLEAAVLLPLVAVLGARHGATGAAWAILIATCAFGAFWLVMYVRIHTTITTVGGDPRAAEGGGR